MWPLTTQMIASVSSARSVYFAGSANARWKKKLTIMPTTRPAQNVADIATGASTNGTVTMTITLSSQPMRMNWRVRSISSSRSASSADVGPDDAVVDSGGGGTVIL